MSSNNMIILKREINKLLSTETEKETPALNLSNRDLTQLPELSCYPFLKKVNLAGNSLLDLLPIADNKALTWLNLAKNRIDLLTGVSNLTNLKVLNVSCNNLTEFDEIQALENLAALILNNNKISQIPDLSPLSNLNTLVLSHNSISQIEGISNLANLKKLSLSGNKLTALNNIEHNTSLTELRINKNKISLIEEENIIKNEHLRVIDAGHNNLVDIESIQALTCLKRLRNLNLKGNPIVELPYYPAIIIDIIPSLVILDGQKLKRSNTSKNIDVKQKKRKMDSRSNSLTKVGRKQKALKRGSRQSTEKSFFLDLEQTPEAPTISPITKKKKSFRNSLKLTPSKKSSKFANTPKVQRPTPKKFTRVKAIISDITPKKSKSKKFDETPKQKKSRKRKLSEIEGEFSSPQKKKET
eukprot:TRINITY_DN6073_c0_g1_i1.p1 TRINITY_DN6073_c0_g1~~TRINITY_DN6073_c0_g1_i1.p1  ORF type:complete len:423 (-),score=86.15 TRINITY_DN6073_c0_g1_i1:1011-2249(-)